MVETHAHPPTWTAQWRQRGRFSVSYGLLPCLLVALFLLFGLYDQRFWHTTNLINVLRSASYLMIISAGQMVVLIIGGFDLSVGGVAALTSVTMALTMAQATVLMPNAVALVVSLGVLVGLIAGSAIGLVNGIIVAVLRVNPFMVTVGSMSVAYGIALYVTAGAPVYGMPEAFTQDFADSQWLGLPVTVYLTIAVLFGIWVIMSSTRIGRYIYAVGSNLRAARLSGVPTITCIIIAYVASSLLASVTGVLLTARVGSGEANLAQTLMLESIAAAVIGGVSLRGGVGHVGSVALGALFLALVTNGLDIMHIDSRFQPIVIGTVLIVAVGLDRITLTARRP
jgi:ribose transport system permease protein